MHALLARGGALLVTLVVSGVGGARVEGAPPVGQSAPELSAVFRGIKAHEIALSPCGRYVAAAGRQDGTDRASALLIVWDLQTRKEVFRYRSPSLGCLDTVTFSPDGKLLAAAGMGDDKTATVWQFPSGKEIARLDNDGNVAGLRFSPDGKLLAMATVDSDELCHTVLWWETEHYRKKPVLKASADLILSPSFSRDGKFLACGAANGFVHVWDVNGGKAVGKLMLGRDYMRAVSFCFGSNRLAAAGLDGRIHLITDAGNLGKQVPLLRGQLRGQAGGVFSALFSPDDQWLFTGGEEPPPGKKLGSDGTVQVWNVAEEKLHAKWKAHTSAVLGMALSGDGRTLITASADETVKVWSLPKWQLAPAKD